MSDYYESLGETEWKNKRIEILKRDNYRCTICQRTRTEEVIINNDKGEGVNQENVVHVGLDYSKNKAIIMGDIIKCSKDLFKSGMSKGRLRSKTKIFENNIRYFLINQRHLLTANFLDIKDFNQGEITYGIAHTEDGALMGVIIKGEENIKEEVKTVARPFTSMHPLELHVHHKYYIVGRKPWDYSNEVLVTLCSDCHKKIHKLKITEVPFYNLTPNGLKIKLEYTPCQRCDGMGYLEEYRYYRNGICFRCNGAKFEELILPFDSDYNISKNII